MAKAADNKLQRNLERNIAALLTGDADERSIIEQNLHQIAQERILKSEGTEFGFAVMEAARLRQAFEEDLINPFKVCYSAFLLENERETSGVDAGKKKPVSYQTYKDRVKVLLNSLREGWWEINDAGNENRRTYLEGKLAGAGLSDLEQTELNELQDIYGVKPVTYVRDLLGYLIEYSGIPHEEVQQIENANDTTYISRLGTKIRKADDPRDAGDFVLSHDIKKVNALRTILGRDTLLRDPRGRRVINFRSFFSIRNREDLKNALSAYAVAERIQKGVDVSPDNKYRILENAYLQYWDSNVDAGTHNRVEMIRYLTSRSVIEIMRGKGEAKGEFYEGCRESVDRLRRIGGIVRTANDMIRRDAQWSPLGDDVIDALTVDENPAIAMAASLRMQADDPTNLRPDEIKQILLFVSKTDYRSNEYLRGAALHLGVPAANIPASIAQVRALLPEKAYNPHRQNQLMTYATGNTDPGRPIVQALGRNELLYNLNLTPEQRVVVEKDWIDNGGVVGGEVDPRLRAAAEAADPSRRLGYVKELELLAAHHVHRQAHPADNFQTFIDNETKHGINGIDGLSPEHEMEAIAAAHIILRYFNKAADQQDLPLLVKSSWEEIAELASNGEGATGIACALIIQAKLNRGAKPSEIDYKAIMNDVDERAPEGHAYALYRKLGIAAGSDHIKKLAHALDEFPGGLESAVKYYQDHLDKIRSADAAAVIKNVHNHVGRQRTTAYTSLANAVLANVPPEDAHQVGQLLARHREQIVALSDKKRAELQAVLKRTAAQIAQGDAAKIKDYSLLGNIINGFSENQVVENIKSEHARRKGYHGSATRQRLKPTLVWGSVGVLLAGVAVILALAIVVSWILIIPAFIFLVGGSATIWFLKNRSKFFEYVAKALGSTTQKYLNEVAREYLRDFMVGHMSALYSQFKKGKITEAVYLDTINGDYGKIAEFCKKQKIDVPNLMGLESYYGLKFNPTVDASKGSFSLSGVEADPKLQKKLAKLSDIQRVTEEFYDKGMTAYVNPRGQTILAFDHNQYSAGNLEWARRCAEFQCGVEIGSFASGSNSNKIAVKNIRDPNVKHAIEVMQQMAKEFEHGYITEIVNIPNPKDEKDQFFAKCSDNTVRNLKGEVVLDDHHNVNLSAASVTNYAQYKNMGDPVPLPLPKQLADHKAEIRQRNMAAAAG
ncbi:MAG: hypothetical protein IPP74_08930 [Alphaproteobacteria bacterium]|nr:hypothetical protein [Alphaproteobacteria bacterium]